MKSSLALGLILLMASSANAALIQGVGSLPNAQALLIPAINYVGTGPVRFGNATWSSNDPGSVFGSTSPFVYDSGPAGSPSEPIMRNDRDFPSSMKVTFDRPVKGVLAKIYWNNSASSPFGFNSGESAGFLPYSESGALLSEPGCTGDRAMNNCYWALNDNGANPDRFGRFFPESPGYFGFWFAEPVIKSIDFNNRFMGVTQLFFAPGVPEPANWAMLIAGFGLVGAMARRRRGAVVA